MKNLLTANRFSYGIFWSWNILYVILFILLEVNTGFSIRIIADGITGLAPLDFTLAALVAYLLPLACILLAFSRFRHHPQKLIRLFYGAEVPLTLLCLLRLFLIREATPGISHLFFLLVAGMGGYMYGLLRNETGRGSREAIIVLLLNTTYLIIGVYAGLILLFYLPPAIVGFLQLLIEIPFIEILTIGILALISGIFIVYSLTLLLGLPVMLIYLYISEFAKSFRMYTAAIGIKRTSLVSGSWLIMNAGLFYFLNWHQPQINLFDKLDNITWTSTTMSAFASEEDEIKKGLLNAYLSPYRYLGEEEKNHHIEEIYRAAFKGKKERYNTLQTTHNLLLKPFLYMGRSFREDRAKAEELYQELFDAPIQKAEKESIKKALKATWERDGVEAGLLNIDDKNVHTISQRITVSKKGELAEIELHETYQNKTFNQQEVLYYFSLPEHAVITGLWLSDDDNEKKYSYRVSPRGAAQQVYKNEVQRRVDPSLLEQTGPGQYRLRAFPIEPKRFDYTNQRRTEKAGPLFHLWLRYQILTDENGGWQLPAAAQKRNVYQDGKTIFTINGKKVKKEYTEEWLPASISAGSKPVPSVLAASIGEYGTIRAVPLPKQEVPQIPAGKSLALVLDKSYSMNKNKNKLAENWHWLQKSGLLDNNTVDMYSAGFKNEKLAAEGFEIDKEVFFGNHTLNQILQNADSIRLDKMYDALIVLTDEGDYESAGDEQPAPLFPFPVYLVHTNGRLPYAYEDNLLETLEHSGGRVFTHVKNALEYMAIKENSGQEGFLFNEHGYSWSYEPISTENAADITEMAARLFINKRSLNRLETEERIPALDRIHTLARTQGIVTAFSSMIVLVNERQHQALDEAENREDRFDRETETGKENITSPSFSLSEVSGTPEPEEWALLIIGALLILYGYRRHLYEIFVKAVR